VRRRRPVVQYASMTSLADVMFVLVFASLIYSAGLEEKAREAEAAALSPPPELQMWAPEIFDPGASAARGTEELRQAALSKLMLGLEGRSPVVARVGRDGQLRELERQRDGRAVSTALGLPLVERVPDPDVALIYLGDRHDGPSLCNLVRLHLGAADLSDALIIVAPDVPLDRLSVALARGLQRDAERCLADQRGIAVIVDPRAAPSTAPQQGDTR